MGMYRIYAPSSATHQVRLLGAGLMLREVRAAAQLLHEDWGIATQVWSCPSYTKLAPEAEKQSRVKRLQRGAAQSSCHLQDCLKGSRTPLIAVTGYAEFVAAQLGAHVSAPLTALGADSLEPRQRLDRHWIAVTALRALACQEEISASAVGEPMKRYCLD